VTNLRNGRSVDVTVTDRGPVVRHRILDVSLKAAERLGMRKAGVTTVRVQPIAEPKAGR
jgi:rare lipoprotein A